MRAREDAHNINGQKVFKVTQRLILLPIIKFEGLIIGKQNQQKPFSDLPRNVQCA